LPGILQSPIESATRLSKSNKFNDNYEREFSFTSISVTVGLMNLVGSWFGAVPTCHGVGGLAGQYKFGERSGGCVALLGFAKLVLGLQGLETS
jgi:hypothetical protein